MNAEDEIYSELDKLEKESESLLEGIDMNNLTESDAEKVQNILDNMFNRIKEILEKSNQIEDNE